MRELPHTHSCFVCGEANPLGLKLRFETDGRIVRTRFAPRAEHIGFKQVVHGGLLATVMDEIMVWVCAVRARRFAFCADLSVRYRQRAQPGMELVVTGELVSNRRNKIFEAKASVANAGGEILAAASGRYVPINPADLRPMADELIGDWRWLLGEGR